jgi:hypothetical protein
MAPKGGPKKQKEAEKKGYLHTGWVVAGWQLDAKVKGGMSATGSESLVVDQKMFDFKECCGQHGC